MSEQYDGPAMSKRIMQLESQLSQARAELEEVKKSQEFWEQARFTADAEVKRWRTLAEKAREVLEKMNVCDCRKGLGHHGAHLENCASRICGKVLSLFPPAESRNGQAEETEVEK